MTAIKIKDLGKKVMDDYNAAMANPSTEYERGFVDGAQHQMKLSVDKAVNRMAKTEHEPWLLESTQTLAKTLAREFYPEVTQWKCLNDLAGVISQIDNMTTGLMRKPKQEPLTDEQIVEIYTNWESKKGTSWADLMRAVEAAHDIKETKI
jgi:hypothetical protein